MRHECSYLCLSLFSLSVFNVNVLFKNVNRPKVNRVVIFVREKEEIKNNNAMHKRKQLKPLVIMNSKILLLFKKSVQIKYKEEER